MNAANVKGTLFWIPTFILSALTLFLLIWLDVRPETTLYDIVSKGDLKRLEKVLSTNPDLDALNREGLVPLVCAVNAGHVDVIQVLLKAGADVDSRSANGSTALQYAIRQDNLDIISILLDERCGYLS